MTYTGKAENGNKLEKNVYEKLTDPTNICYLKAGSLMYFHVYADLVMLSKSTSLSKTAFNMNINHLELQLYLEEIERNPSIVVDRDYHVFRSEERLYGDNEEVNHWHHAIKSQCLFENLFTYINK